MTPTEIVRDYHERTKHHFHRYANAPGYMDWDTQPDPFRRFAGAPIHPLPLPAEGDPLRYAELFNPGAVPARPLTVEAISLLLRRSLSLTAWKEYRGSRWALRANPSSGNLHPTEGYLVLPAIAGLHASPAVWHYAPREHALERRADLAAETWMALAANWPPGTFLVALSSIHWREAWKYGERAFRYCQHDIGHALAGLRIAAAAVGWRLRWLDQPAEAEVATLLGLDRAQDFGCAEHEHPDLVAVVWPAGEIVPAEPSTAALKLVGTSHWHGTANPLSAAHSADWPIIETVATAASKPRTDASNEVAAGGLAPRPEAIATASTNRAERIVLGRRSAVAYDGMGTLSFERLLLMLTRTLPGHSPGTPPFDAWPFRPRIHLALFVHRVDGLVPGLYLLARDPGRVERLRAAMRPEFLFARPPGCPEGLELLLLRAGDVRALAAEVSCGQEIAGKGAFSLGMIAELEDGIAGHGAWFYRALFWEAGVIGQVLYLEAEDAGIRATGIGCYFDDPVHEVFGLRGSGLQSLYHFTIGVPVEDTRLTTLPPYPAL